MTLIEELKALCEADLSLRITDAAEYSRIETNALKQKIRYILSRHQSEIEPLAVLADRKGMCVMEQWIYRKDNKWRININSLDDYEDKSNTFCGRTYSDAESQARQYLLSLPDREGDK